VHDQRLQALHLLDQPDDVHIVDALRAHDVVHLPVGAVLDSPDERAAEIADVERLAHVAAVAGIGNTVSSP
jgi:hypothetical protein